MKNDDKKRLANTNIENMGGEDDLKARQQKASLAKGL